MPRRDRVQAPARRRAIDEPPPREARDRGYQKKQ